MREDTYATGKHETNVVMAFKNKEEAHDAAVKFETGGNKHVRMSYDNRTVEYYVEEIKLI